MIRRVAVFTVVFALLTSAPAEAQGPSSVRDSLVAAMSSYLQALRSNDPWAVSHFWTDDVVYIPAGSPTVRGRVPFDSLIRGVFATMRLTEVTEHTDDVLVDRDIAVQTGTYSETLQPSTGPVIVERGRYMFVWRRQPAGGWKIARGMSTDSPGATPH